MKSLVSKPDLSCASAQGGFEPPFSNPSPDLPRFAGKEAFALVGLRQEASQVNQ